MIRLRYVYRITNLANGKTYIGQHTVRTNRTITSDTYMGSGKVLHRAFKKYGIENFKKDILVSGEFTKDEIDKLEIEYIKNERAIGKAEYNLASGGNGGDLSQFIDYDSETFHQHVSEGVKKTYANGRKASGWAFHDGMKGKHLSDEAKQKLRENHLGERNSQYGKKQSDETKRKKHEARLRAHDELFSKIRLYLEQLNLDKISMNDKVEIGKKFDCSYKTVERVWNQMSKK